MASASDEIEPIISGAGCHPKAGDVELAELANDADTSQA
jgi:hypothetical protein